MMDETQARKVLADATAPPKPGPGQLVDPPEVARYAQRGDPPISEWPGRAVTRKDLMVANGDPRDWFRYGHRNVAFEEAWEEFADARNRRPASTIQRTRHRNGHHRRCRQRHCPSPHGP